MQLEVKEVLHSGVYTTIITVVGLNLIDEQQIRRYGDPVIEAGGYFAKDPGAPSVLTIGITAQPADLSVITVNDGTNSRSFTFVVAPGNAPGATEVLIGADIAVTAANLMTKLDASVLLGLLSRTDAIITVTHENVVDDYIANVPANVTQAVTTHLPVVQPAFTLPRNSVRVRRAVPFTMSFDPVSELAAGNAPTIELARALALEKSKVWRAAIEARITAAVAAMRALSLYDFADNSVKTI